MTLHHAYAQTPVGRLKLVASESGLVAVLWENDDQMRVRLTESIEDETHPVIARTATELDEYFHGDRRDFSVPLDFHGTDFQKSVWAALLRIPYGQTRTYMQIAEELGDRGAVRAVGAANGRNPISIIAPCHRVVGASGKLTGFAGGIDVKARLLALEGAHSFALAG